MPTQHLIAVYLPTFDVNPYLFRHTAFWAICIGVLPTIHNQKTNINLLTCRSAGDVNDIEHLPSSDGSAGSTPTNSSIGSDGKKEPPPPPPRRKEKGHSRSSSLDLNKLFGPKSKETRGNKHPSVMLYAYHS